MYPEFGTTQSGQRQHGGVRDVCVPLQLLQHDDDRLFARTKTPARSTDSSGGIVSCLRYAQLVQE